MKVDNKKSVRRIACRSLLANKRRNLIAITAIMLTAILFTTLFTIILSINSSYETSTFRQIGGCPHGTFKDVTDEQIEKLTSADKSAKFGARTVIGVISSGVFANRSAEISCMDENTAKWMYIDLKEGHYPEAKNEIIMDTEVLRLLGKEPVLGEKIDISFTDAPGKGDELIFSETFILCGYWDFDSLSPAHFINVSKGYVDDFIEECKAKGLGIPRTDLDIMFSSSFNIVGKMLRIARDAGYETGERTTDRTIRIGVNPGYTSQRMIEAFSADTVVSVLAFSFLIIFTGYLIIYNIFQISVANDIRFYGLLKTIGVTPAQVKKIIRYQALILCVIGIPLGLLAGYGLGAVLTKVVLKTTNISLTSLTITTSPFVFVMSALFEIGTVILSTSKPGRTAAAVSPIEAIRYTEASPNGKTQRKMQHGSRIIRMAFANMSRNKKKTLLVFISLALALVLLNVVVMFVGGFDTEKWISSEVTTDFVIGTSDYFHANGIANSHISMEDIDHIKNNTECSSGGIAYSTTLVPMVKISNDKSYEYLNELSQFNICETDGAYSYLLSIMEAPDRDLLSRIETIEGDASLLNDSENRYIAFIGHRNEDGTLTLDAGAPDIGDKVIVAFAEGMQMIDKRTGEPPEDYTYLDPEYAKIDYVGLKEYEYTVCAYIEVPKAISPRAQSTGMNFVIGYDTLSKDIGNSLVPMLYAFDAKDRLAEEKAEEFLKSFSEETNNYVIYESKAIKRSEFGEFKGMFLLLGGVLCAVIGLVGILNFTNAVLAGIIVRKNEFAILEAIGMSGKQLMNMLITEGLIYTVGAGTVALMLALIMAPLLNSLSETMFWFYSGHFTITPVIISIPVMALLGFLVPLLAVRSFTKESIVERIRVIG